MERQQRVRRHPARHHPEAADEREVLERAEVGHPERAVRRGRRGGRRERRGPRLLVGDEDGVGRRAPGAPLLEVAGHVDDAEVDPVAGHDAEEKARRHVEVADGELRRAERPGDSGGDRQAHRDERAQAHEEEEDDREHERDARAPPTSTRSLRTAPYSERPVTRSPA